MSFGPIGNPYGYGAKKRLSVYSDPVDWGTIWTAPEPGHCTGLDSKQLIYSRAVRRRYFSVSFSATRSAGRLVTSRSGQQFWHRADSVPSRALDATGEGTARSGELATARHHSGLYLYHFPDRWAWISAAVASYLGRRTGGD